MYGRILFGVSIWAILVVTQNPEDTAPPVPPPPSTTQQTPPADPNNCKLSGYSPLGFVVKIWNKTAGNTTGHGSLISPIAILTTATTHDRNNVTDYEAIGQNIWNQNMWNKPCMQVRIINYSIVHDKCCDPENSKFFNFMIFVLNAPFEVSSRVEYEEMTFPIYPVLFLPTEPITALLSIIEFNSGNSKVTNCSLALFTDLKDRKPAIMSKKDQEMQGMAYNKTCIPLMCEEEYRDGNGVSKERCEEDYLMKKYGTMMCVEPKDKSRKPSLPPNTKKSTEFYGGAPLLCNDVAFGIVTEVFVREVPKERPGHFFLIATFLRVYEWLLRQQQHFSKKPEYISVESWNMPPRYRSSEPVPAYFLEKTTKSAYVRGISPTRKLSATLAFLTSLKILSLFAIFV